MSTLKKKKAFDYTIVLKIVCILAMVAFMFCQFLPFWQYDSYTEESYRNHILYGEPLEGETREISLADYVWFTEDHEDLFGEWDEGLYNFDGEQIKQNDITGMPFLATLLIAFGLLFFLWKAKSLWPCVFAVAAGAYAVIGYTTDAANVYKAGASYQYHLIASIVLLVAGVAVAVPWIIRIVKWFTVKKRHY